MLLTAITWLISMSMASTTSELNLTTKEGIQAYFELARKAHLEAYNAVNRLPKYEQKYQMLTKLFANMYEHLAASRVQIEKSGYVLGEFPVEGAIESVLRNLDCCAFFGNLVVRFPKIGAKILNAHKTWLVQYRWCFEFALSSNLVDETSAKMFKFAAKKLGLLPTKLANNVDEEFANSSETWEDVNKDGTKRAQSTTTSKPKRQLSRGPRLSRREL